MTQLTLEAVQAKIDGLAREYFSESDYELFCAILLQLDKYRALADSNRVAIYNQDKEFSEHMDIQQAKVESLNRELAYWQHKCTMLYVENEHLKKSGEGAEYGGGNTNGTVSERQ